MPTDDDCFGQARIRADGRKLHPAYLLEVKKPSESKGPWDYYKLLATTPADQAFRPLDKGGCPLGQGLTAASSTRRNAMDISRRTLLGTAAATAALPAAGHRARAEADTIKIGVLNDQSGPYTDTGGVTSVAAAKRRSTEFAAATDSMSR